MRSTHEYHQGAKYIAESVDQMNWTPAVWIESYQRYEPIQQAPAFTNADAAIRWARDIWA